MESKAISQKPETGQVYLPIYIGWNTPYELGLDKLDSLFDTLESRFRLALGESNPLWYDGTIAVPIEEDKFERYALQIEEFVIKYIKSELG